MIFSHEQYIDAIVRMINRNPTRVFVSTFNFHVGISGTGAMYTKAPMYQIMDYLNTKVKDVRVMVGLPPLDSQAGKLINSAEHFSNIEWRYRQDLHLKCFIFHYGRSVEAITGGRNLGDSKWFDASCFLSSKDARELNGFFVELWKQARPVPTSEFRLKV